MNMLDLMDKAEGKKVNRPNAESIIAGLKQFSEISTNPDYSMEAPHRFIQYLAQVSHESGGFTYDKELWGPTPAQKGYEGRKDLGNTQPGDGFLFRGRTGIQNTGRANARKFTAWARSYWPDAPDFEKTPDAMLTDPWEGLSPIWFWQVGNKTNSTLNRYADEGNLEAITRKINGGTNGLEDRWNRYVKYALAYMGHSPDKAGIRKFQEAAGFTGKDIDGIAGMKTRAAIHAALVALDTGVAPAPILLPVVGNVAELTEKAFKRALEAWG